jgi:hypothetical protein
MVFRKSLFDTEDFRCFFDNFCYEIISGNRIFEAIFTTEFSDLGYKWRYWMFGVKGYTGSAKGLSKYLIEEKSVN